MAVFDRRLRFDACIIILSVLAMGATGHGNRRTLNCLQKRNCRTTARAQPATPTLSFSWGGVLSGSGTATKTPPAPPSVILQKPVQTDLVDGEIVTESVPTVVYYEPSFTKPVKPTVAELPLSKNEAREPTSKDSLGSAPPTSGSKSDKIGTSNDHIGAPINEHQPENGKGGLGKGDKGSAATSQIPDKQKEKPGKPGRKKKAGEVRGDPGMRGDETDGAESSSFYDDQVLQSLSQTLQIPREAEAESEVTTSCTTVPFEIARYPNLVILSQALEAAGLLKYLDNPKLEVTMFAPTDLAFELMLEKNDMTVSEFLEDHKSVREVLSLHIAEKPLVTSNLRSSQSVDTWLSGSPILVSTSLNDVLVVPPGGDAADVILADISACRSVVHIVDQVLMPTQDPLEVVAG